MTKVGIKLSHKDEPISSILLPFRYQSRELRPYFQWFSSVLSFTTNTKQPFLGLQMVPKIQVPIIFKLLYDSNASLSFQWCLTIYCWIVASLSILTTFMLVPSKNEFDVLVAESHAVLLTASAKGKERSNSGINPISTWGRVFSTPSFAFACNFFVVLEPMLIR